MADTSDIQPVILCGGSGTRLWPLSRRSRPKQFADLLGEETLFQASVRRVGVPGYAPPMIVTADDYRFVVSEQLDAIGAEADRIVIEPDARNTAPAILAAARLVADRAPETVMLVLPSDHAIPDADAFRAAVTAGRDAAERGRLVTFGIRPDRPETGYGYLELEPDGGDGAQALRGFVEKPDAERAAAMLADGNYLWNAGIFLFRADAILSSFRAHCPELTAPVENAVARAEPDLGFLRLDGGAWSGAREISIDHAVMEKADNLSVVPFSGKWSDLGDWQAIWRVGGGGTVTQGQVAAIDCESSLLRSEREGQVLVGIGLTDVIAVSMGDAVLVADRSRAQDVKLAVDALRAEGLPQARQHPIDYRPWGWFESLAKGDRFQVKRITVRPGQSLSLQSHHHRSEHWIVVQGTARVTVDDTVSLISENQSVYIPLGAVHRLENPGKLDMVLIEVQTGSYLGEDDITRHEDIYARK